MNSVAVSAPANIAIIKYWGKEDAAKQWPANDSLSMTLDTCRTFTKVAPSEVFHLKVNGAAIAVGSQIYEKVWQHLKRCQDFLKLTGIAPCSIESKNNFPTGAGIASSASSMAALTLGYLSWLTQSDSFESLAHNGVTKEAVADLARQASGSAARSVDGGYVAWKKGASPATQKISQIFPQDHWQLANIVVVVDKSEKPISTSEAHKKVWQSSLFVDTRLPSIKSRYDHLVRSIADRDFETFAKIAETEATEIHAVIEEAIPGFSYLKPETYKLCEEIRLMRQRGLNVCFSIDAGPNVHILCEEKDEAEVHQNLVKDFSHLKFIRDQIGEGARFEF